jgi:glutamine synthetase adenylyltransferase
VVERVTDLDDPRRCKAGTRAGQCVCVAPEGSDYCYLHAGVDRTPEKNLRQYLLLKAEDRTRLAYFAEHEEVKSLRDEIALARMLIERRFNLIHNDADLLSACGSLNQLFITVERLVKSAHAIEQSLGSLLARQSVLRLGQQICQIIIDRLEGVPNYEQLVDVIIEDIVSTIQRANNSEVRALSAPE